MNPVYSVSKITQYIKILFMRDGVLPRLTVEGEVSNLKYHSSGHIYFTLKDEGAQLRCTMFRDSRKAGLQFPMQEGDLVQVLGRISVFERDGVYQMYADRIVRAGLGVLFERFEQLKKKLYAEGLFDEAHKKPLPLYPKRVGIVTSRTGAALRDIVSILHRRNPYVQPVLVPAQVQGAGASETIVRAIRRLAKEGVDVVIVGRGGGSIEDLWAFNEENVARAVYDCPVPVISCVGHETDTTIIDYVADLRAPTPSAAAELAVREADELLGRLADYHSELTFAVMDRIQRLRDQVAAYGKMLAAQKPKERLIRRRDRLDTLGKDIKTAMAAKLDREKHRISVYAARLDGVSPVRKLSGGYGYVSDPDGKPVTSVASKQKGDEVRIVLRDGELRTEVKEVCPSDGSKRR